MTSMSSANAESVGKDSLNLETQKMAGRGEIRVEKGFGVKG